LKNKYGAKKIKDPATGYVFDSKAEFIRWCELRILERAGKISGLKSQVKYELIPAQREESTEVYKAGPQKGLPKPGAVIEKACTYVADFVYWENGRFVVEDTKGVRTDAYRIKKKLMLWIHGIKVKET
jgi:hypothetical protein